MGMTYRFRSDGSRVSLLGYGAMRLPTVDGGHAKTTKMQTFGFRDPKNRAKTFQGIARAMAEQWG